MMKIVSDNPTPVVVERPRLTDQVAEVHRALHSGRDDYRALVRALFPSVDDHMLAAQMIRDQAGVLPDVENVANEKLANIVHALNLVLRRRKSIAALMGMLRECREEIAANCQRNWSLDNRRLLASMLLTEIGELTELARELVSWQRDETGEK
jgi:hypothetical protein